MSIVLKRLAAVAMTQILSGCFDADATVDVQSPDEIRINVTITADQSMLDWAGDDAKRFCEDDQGSMDEDKVVCVLKRIGSIDELNAGSEKPMFFDLGNGRVKFETATETLYSIRWNKRGFYEYMLDFSDSQFLDSMGIQLEQLEGHTVALTVRGRSIVDTNMKLSADKRSATFDIPLETLPDRSNDDFLERLYAIVDTRF